jgi:hypothetical protein
LYSDLFGYKVNESTTNTASEKRYDKLEGSENIIKSRIFEDDVVHIFLRELKYIPGLRIN